MVGATALGSVMGLTFSGAYLAGGMAQAAVTTAPGYKAEATRLASSDIFSTGRVEIGSISSTSRHDGETVFGAAERAGFSALSNPYSQAPGSVGDSFSKRQAFGQSYNVVGGREFPETGVASEYSMRKDRRELDCLTTALYYEARGEGESGMAAVAQVIVNRARHPDFPKTLCGVIYQGAGKGRGCQFSFACDGSMRRRTEPVLWERARSIAERAMEGPVSASVGTSTFFHATRISPRWRGLTRVATVGRHVFYRHAGARGSGANFLRGPVGDIGGGVQLASVTSSRSEARLYKVASTAPKTERATRTLKASYEAEPAPVAPYRIASQVAEETSAPQVEPAETLSLDALVDAAVTTAS